MTADRQRALSDALRIVGESDRGSAYIERATQQAEVWRRDPAWLWWALIRSFSTMGRSAAWERVERRLDDLAFARLADDTPDAQRMAILQVFRDCGVRMRHKKADWLVKAIARIQQLGGVTEAGSIARQQRDAIHKLEFLQQFDGIGPKYSRNIWMDLKDPDVSSHIAIDARIKRVLAVAAPDLVDPCYDEHEQFLLDAARAAGMEPWAADRLMYAFTDEVLRLLGR